MCGIAGIWVSNNMSNDDAVPAKEMVNIISHRGPDGSSFHYNKEKGLMMGHARLSIIDLETGSQPLYNEDKENVLTVNGEFYGYKKIRSELNLEGFNFRTKSDSEIALYLYEKHGLDFVHHLRGEFAFALYDGKKDRLIVVRDRFGIRPFFYHHHKSLGKEAFVYGSEIKSLFAHPLVPREFDKQAVLHQLIHTMVPGSSPYKDVHALKPGHMMIIQRNGDSFEMTEKCYWDMDFPKENEREIKDDNYYIDGVKEKLLEAVSLRLEADVPVGCYLSGGIDSCSMLGLASAMQQSPVKAYTISFDHDAYDESKIAIEMAERVNADHEILNLSADELYGENYIKTLWHAERTFYNTLGVAKWGMSKRVNESGYRVVVTGEGADELFGGYPAFKRDMLRYGYDKSKMTAEEAKSFGELMDKNNNIFKGAILSEDIISHPTFEKLCGFTPSWIQPWMKTLEIAKPLLTDELQAELKDYDPIGTIAESFDQSQIEERHVLDKAQYTWIKTMLECQILNWGGDRVDMANSMESRPAFLDHHVAEFAREIPPHIRIKGNIEKWVLREAMKNILPEVLYKREKFAFMAPPSHTGESKKKAFQKLMDEFMSEERIREVGIFDVKRLTQFLEDYKNDTDPVLLVRKDALVNHILGLHILYRQFIKQDLKVEDAITA
ncbi:asparagine synthase (glutamine-hydrolyzing) [Flexithrix dorotheae]|uniref:asparagine synthase (glutamine-hydrolyzing) n=1 Tax=Flexithrix dorotheae TaxID=70993 RepID=UPI0003631152|nr:asparagine synthase (glutamine-hydrolyzing) [Flexithrix dorotheae]